MSHQRAKYDIVIDSDFGDDDFHTLSYFYASLNFKINKVISCGGTISSEIAYNNIVSPQKAFHHVEYD